MDHTPETPFESSCSFDIDSHLKVDTIFRDSYLNRKNTKCIEKFLNEQSRLTIMNYCNTSDHFVSWSDGLNNGFFKAIFLAYSRHLPITLSPDNFFQIIMQEISRHININAEKFKHIFVDPSAKEPTNIIVDIDGKTFIDGIDMITDKLTEIVKDDTITSLSTKPFSTTTPLIMTSYKSVLMSSMKKYFTFEMKTRCGINKVFLNGTLDDWKDLLNRVHQLRSMPYAEGIESKLDRMIININNIIESYQGSVNKDFWRSIVRDLQNGSGSSIINGWILDFFIYDVNNKPIVPILWNPKLHVNKFDGEHCVVNISDIPSGFSAIPFVFDIKGNKIKMMLYSGQSGVQILPNGSVSPNFMNTIVTVK